MSANEGRGDVVVFGDNSTAIGFKLAGVRRSHEARDDFPKRMQEAMNDASVSIVIVNENLLERLPLGLRKKVNESIRPIVVPVQSREGGVSDSGALRSLIKRAIGFDLIGE